MFYSQGQQQPQALPHRTDVLEHQFINVSGNNPPYMPQVQGLDPHMSQYLGFITGSLALEISNHANANSLRRFMFNQCANNAFQNAEFDDLVRATLDYIVMLITRQGVPSIEQAIQMAVPEMAALMCAVNTRIYPPLTSVVPREIFNEVQNDIHKFDSIVQQLRNPNMPIQQPQFQQRGGFQQGGFQQQVPQGAVDPRFGNRNAPVQQQAMPGRTTSSSVFSTGGGSSAFSNNAAPTGKFSKPAGFVPTGLNPRQEAPVNVQQQQQAVHQESFLNPTEAIEVPYANALWEPTPEFPYYPIHNPITVQLLRVTNPDGTVGPIMRKKDTDNMDYDRHAVPTAFGKPPQSLDLSQAARMLSRIQYGVGEINKASKGPEPVEEGQDVIPVKPLINAKRIIDTSEQGAWLTTGLARLQLIDRPEVYRGYAVILEPIITETDESDAVKTLANCASYVMAREFIESSFDVLSPELLAAFDQRLTAEVNRSIKQELGIPRLSIDSFREDITSLIEHLEKEEGVDIKNAFLSRQRAHILAAVRPVPEEDAKNLTASFLSGHGYPENELPSITYVSTAYSLTYLNIRSFELDMELSSKGLGSACTEALSPVLYSLVAGIFEDADKHPPVDRHLIRTNDGRIMEATKGAIGKNILLLSIVK